MVALMGLALLSGAIMVVELSEICCGLEGIVTLSHDGVFNVLGSFYSDSLYFFLLIVSTYFCCNMSGNSE